jgi:hypothetical protein
MKKTLVALAVVAVLGTATFAVVSAQDDGPAPEKGMVIGLAVELSTYAMKDMGSEDSIAAMKVRAEQGFPIGIVEEETGSLWIPVYRHTAPASPMQTANTQLTPLLGKVIAMQGLKYRQGEVNVIRFNLVSEY